jgi:hypothetical protein
MWLGLMLAHGLPSISQRRKKNNGRLYWPGEMQEEELSVLLSQGEGIMSVSQICQYKGCRACVLKGCECSCHKDRG